VQYASLDYAAELQQHGFRISMSRIASPYDNAQAESFIKTLQYEEVYRTEYRNLEEARASIGEFLEKTTTVSVCIRRSVIVHPWSSSASCTPQRPGEYRHEFSEAWGIYRSDDVSSNWEQAGWLTPSAHRTR
jgi:transposase InsO family protein